MRFTDLAFTLPGLPLVILVLSFVEPSVWLISLAYLAIIWKQTARVLRSEVITVKERTFVKGARASGAGHLRTMFVHVAPNVLPIGFLYGAYSVGWAIYGQAASRSSASAIRRRPAGDACFARRSTRARCARPGGGSCRRRSVSRSSASPYSLSDGRTKR
jgi:hypothetical protein